MENINLHTPYKIIQNKHKRYSNHYVIPSSECIIVPTKKYGDQICCDVVWRADSGEVQSRSNLMFDNSNLEPVSPMRDFILHTLWQEHHERVLQH